MNITYYGQNCFGFEMAGKKILVDPGISANPISKHINPDDLSPDYILLTHGHGDHVADVASIASRCGATIISGYEVTSYYMALGHSGHPLNHGGKKLFDFGTVKYVNAVHSSVLPDGTYGGNPGGFVIYDEDISFYIAGDTALTLDMKLIPLTCPKLDFAILPIGDNFTMGIDDAVIAADFVECTTIIGCHYDSFPPIKIDHESAINTFAKADKTLILMEIGTSINI